MQNSARENQEDQGEVSSPPTVELESKQAENEEVGASVTAQGSVLKSKKRIRTQKDKAKNAANMRILRAKIKAKDPSISKKTAEREKNRNKRRWAQYNAVLANNQAKDKELERLRTENRSLEDRNKELEEQLARKELQNSEMEKTIEIYSTVPQHIVLAHWSLHLRERELHRLQQPS